MSVDNIYSHIAWQRLEIGWMDYPLASDFYPNAEVARSTTCFRVKPPIPGINERAIFVIDKEGIIQFSKVYDLGQQPDNAEVFEVLEKLQGEGRELNRLELRQGPFVDDIPGIQSCLGFEKTTWVSSVVEGRCSTPLRDDDELAGSDRELFLGAGFADLHMQ